MNMKMCQISKMTSTKHIKAENGVNKRVPTFKNDINKTIHEPAYKMT